MIAYRTEARNIRGDPGASYGTRKQENTKKKTHNDGTCQRYTRASCKHSQWQTLEQFEQ